MVNPNSVSVCAIPLEDGSVERWELTDQWRLVRTDPPAAAADHSHPTLGDINFIGTVSSSGEAGIDTSGESEFEVAQIESIKIRNGLIVGLTEK